MVMPDYQHRDSADEENPAGKIRNQQSLQTRFSMESWPHVRMTPKLIHHPLAYWPQQTQQGNKVDSPLAHPRLHQLTRWA
jgi:hypothetical protein